MEELSRHLDWLRRFSRRCIAVTQSHVISARHAFDLTEVTQSNKPREIDRRVAFKVMGLPMVVCEKTSHLDCVKLPSLNQIEALKNQGVHENSVGLGGERNVRIKPNKAKR